MKWKIKDIEIANRIVVGPMAGISNLAFRRVVNKFQPGLVYGEMLSDKALMYENQKTLAMSKTLSDQTSSMQIMGNDLESMLYAAKYLDQYSDCQFIDINMGCPATKVVKNESGSAMMKDIDNTTKIVEQIVKAVKKPVTVKMRLGYENNNMNYLQLAKKLESVGVAAICLHARTKEMMYEGKADYSHIKTLKENLSIPVIGNGDITSVEDAKRMLEETGCDAIMLCRGAYYNPFLVAELVKEIECYDLTIDDSLAQRIELGKFHAQALIEIKGEIVAMKEMRAHAQNYIKGYPFANRYKLSLSNIKTYDELVAIYDDFYQKYGGVSDGTLE